MWLYEQATGKLFDQDGELVGAGYSGGNCGQNPEGKNNPAMQKIHCVGPLPIGVYTISPPEDTVTHGPFVLPLTPYPTNFMFGRSGFLIHGDSVLRPGDASEGCIIMPRAVRERIWQSHDYSLQVIAEKA
ncbi:MAG TPA: tlde1 domain-containing protein [Candidatus Sulfotelmatobacter sp.]|nr:tlde1 domain-containing protein [Candidatus Sulfotelmatobacter sp.]